MNILTLIVNLPSSIIRKKHMEELLSPYEFIVPHFIEAVDGRKISSEEIDKVYDEPESIKRYGRVPNDGEKGCTLSHRKCFQTLLNSDYEFALILEDDIHPIQDLNTLKGIDIDGIMNTDTPTVLFLSGDFWYTNTKNGIANVYSAVGTYAYIINRSAAKKILDKFPTPFNVADDWLLLKKAGLQYKAVIPYVIDANLDMATLGSEVNQYSWGIDRSKMSFKNLLESYSSGLIKRFLKSMGFFESKIRVINNVPVEK